MSLYKLYKMDPKIESQGIWFTIGTGEEKPARFLLARAGGSNKKFNRAFEQRTAPVRRQMQLGTLDDQTDLRIMAEVYAESVILGWENVLGEDGKSLEFTFNNCVKLLTDLPELFGEIQQQAKRISAYRADLREDDAGN